MAKASGSDEVRMLRFFEEGPIEKAEVVFNIVAEKMRERLGGRRAETHAPAKETGVARKRREVPGAPAPGAGATAPPEPGP